ncbi:MAG: carbon starvation protein [Candidatus Binatota bacterium]|nr:carbon starvation protein [Candidatus Binatota bacterium]
MDLTLLVVGAALLFLAAFRFYGRIVAARFDLDDATPTPACLFEDGVDFVPTRPPILLAQHFSAISAAGPIVGPIAAGIWFGWLPALLWIVVGAIFIGAAHDFSALIASMRHGARSVTELMREHVSQRAYLLFLSFIWLSLVYVIVAFTDLTARQFVVEGVGPGVASSSLMYLFLAIALGVCLYRFEMPLGVATAIFVPALFAIIWVGQKAPISVGHFFDQNGQILFWSYVILAYCFVASVLPMWLLLQPRGYLGGYFLYVLLAAGALGIVCGSFLPEPVSLAYPAFVGWRNPQGLPLFPILFVTIACGACSGFHGLVSSGTTSKQVAREGDARLVGYGGMLLEGVVALMALATVMILPAGDPRLARDPNVIFATGIARFLGIFSASPGWSSFCLAFGMLAFATFIYDTLDVATRLGRYILQELTGWRGDFGRYATTLATVAAPALYMGLVPSVVTVGGKPAPVWSVIWPVFGSSNQLLAALTLLAICVWLARSGVRYTLVFVPMLFMLLMTSWALAIQAWPLVRAVTAGAPPTNPNAWIAVVLLLLAALLAREAFAVLFRDRPPASRGPLMTAATTPARAP